MDAAPGSSAAFNLLKDENARLIPRVEADTRSVTGHANEPPFEPRDETSTRRWPVAGGRWPVAGGSGNDLADD